MSKSKFKSSNKRNSSKMINQDTIDLIDSFFIHRYMDLSKFIDLLKTREIFLPCVLQLTDGDEGTILTYLGEHLLQETEYKKSHGGYLQYRDQFEKNDREKTYVSCWSMEGDESYALWKIYVPSGEGLSVTFSKEVLLNSIPKPFSNWAKFGSVEYTSAPIKTNPFFQKSVYYKYEKEFRLVITLPDIKNYTGNKKELKNILNSIQVNGGLRIPVPVHEIIIRVIISPFSKILNPLMIEDLLEKYGIDDVHSERSQINHNK